jgi:hypothetical protein
MGGIMTAVLTGSIVATIAIVMAIAASLQKQVNAKGGCPKCGTPVPMFRNPKSLRQALWGGWTCSNCGTEMDRSGNQVGVEAVD